MDAHPVDGTLYIPYAEGMPVSVRYMGHSYRSVLTVHPTLLVGSSGEWNEEHLNRANGSRLLNGDELVLALEVVEPGRYHLVVSKEPGNVEVRRDGLIIGGIPHEAPLPGSSVPSVQRSISVLDVPTGSCLLCYPQLAYLFA